MATEIRRAVSGASEVHRALCAPEFQLLAGFEIATRIIPARHVGGDFVCTLSRGHRSIWVMGDLMGKGLSAAMWLTHMIDLIRRAAESTDDLPSMMQHLNQELVNSRVGAPLTTALAIELNHETQDLTYTSAGHPPALLVGRAAVRELREGGPILGACPDAKFASGTVNLELGEVLVGYSDGVSEARDVDQNEFTQERIAECVRTHASSDATSCISNLLGSVSNFTEGQFLDDVSVIVVQRV